jgi:putative transposase
MLKAYKVQLEPNNIQISKMKMNCGASRWAFNYALNIKKEQFDKKEKIPNNIELHREINKLKGTETLPWAYEKGISKCSFQEALRDCDKAFSNFFTRCKKRNIKQKGFPKFKSKKNDKQSFRLTGSIRVLDKHIQLPRLGKIKLAEIYYLPKESKILSATVSYRANKWFVSLQIEEEQKEFSQAKQGVIGIDLGIKTLATCSDGTTYENPKALKKNLKRLKRKQKQLSRKKKGSKNYEKAKQKLVKLHYHISNIRKDCLHKITSKIIDENQVIILEDLKVSNMMKNKCLAQAISDVGLYEFRRQISYKAKWNNRKVIFVDTFFPSSKTCSCCGWKNSDLKLTDRIFECKMCDMKMDRDLNASLNLKQIYTGSSSGINASGDGSSSNASLVSPSLNEEFNKKSRVCILKR